MRFGELESNVQDYGESHSFPRDEELYGAMKNEAWYTEVGNFLSEHKTIPMSLKSCGWGTHEEHGKTTVVISFRTDPDVDKFTGLELT